MNLIKTYQHLYYQKRLDIFLAIQGLTLEQYTELTKLLTDN